MGMRVERNMCMVELYCLLRMLNIMPLEQQREELRKEVNNAHITGLNVTEKQ